MVVEFTDDELLELYEVLNRCQQALKHQEQARAALEFTDKPAPYSPLVQRLMAARNRVGEKVSPIHTARGDRSQE